ncbi:polyvinylalcohol dehydrogenase-like [Telopea speciosissima]|uniref:polyvinylalcohol dehydrogenase-like n=1 Tax=Telopea speciosissima TaxID=54955 RepID=UPI001CC6FE02|nr:polyvinylalcohol dehydrogenase-like [Telopea speciosissima]
MDYPPCKPCNCVGKGCANAFPPGTRVIWPELQGAKGKKAMEIIKKENKYVTPLLLGQGSVHVTDVCCNRVFVIVDSEGPNPEAHVRGYALRSKDFESEGSDGTIAGILKNDKKFKSNKYFYVIIRGTLAAPSHCELLARSSSMGLLLVLVVLLLSSLLLLLCLPRTANSASDWLNHGKDIYNSRYASEEFKISPGSVKKMELKWEFFAKSITATPSIFSGTLYFPSWNGSIYAIKECDGSVVWERNVSDLTGLNATGFVGGVLNVSLARATPTVAGDLLIIGIYGPAVVIAVERATGDLVWSTMLDTHPRAVITMSGTAFNGAFYVGTSSLEESLNSSQCCTFRGSLSKLDIQTGTILWQTYTLPDNGGQLGGYAGGSIWGSSPSIDVIRNHVYIATGNLYSAPQYVKDCQAKENNQTTPTQPDKCIEPGNHENSFLAFDMDTGNITWYRQLGGYDIWFIACNNLSTPNCPPGPNPDADFGEAPMMLTIFVNETRQDILVAVQKSGYAWALDRDTGDIIWATFAGPGSFLGGGIWGAATDGLRVYTNIENGGQKNFTLTPSKENTTAGGWVAMDASTGKVIWSIANPSNATSYGPVTVANGVLFAGSTNSKGTIYAMSTEKGEILWSYDTGVSVYSGISVSNGCIYVGNGYRLRGANTSLLAFCVIDL